MVTLVSQAILVFLVIPENQESADIQGILVSLDTQATVEFLVTREIAGSLDTVEIQELVVTPEIVVFPDILVTAVLAVTLETLVSRVTPVSQVSPDIQVSLAYQAILDSLE